MPTTPAASATLSARRHTRTAGAHLLHRQRHQLDDHPDLQAHKQQHCNTNPTRPSQPTSASTLHAPPHQTESDATRDNIAARPLPPHDRRHALLAQKSDAIVCHASHATRFPRHRPAHTARQRQAIRANCDVTFMLTALPPQRKQDETATTTRAHAQNGTRLHGTPCTTRPVTT